MVFQMKDEKKRKIMTEEKKKVNNWRLREDEGQEWC